LFLAFGDSDNAEACFRQNVVISHSLDNIYSLANSFRMLGLIAMRRGAYERAVVLLGCDKKCRDTGGLTLSPGESSKVEDAVIELRSALGFESYEDHFNEGYLLRRAQMVDLALGEGFLLK
jgi:hypothetical protein